MAENEVLACPECDSARVSPTVGTAPRGREADEKYRCTDCGHRFDDVDAVRRPSRDRPGPRHGLARKLDDANPGDLVTDGGPNQTADGAERLQYLRNNEIREEIAYTVGGDPSRYNGDEWRGLRKAEVRLAARQVQPDGNDLTIEEMNLGDLYEVLCKWAGGEYDANAGKPWGINRENLKQIHQALDAQPPREVVSV